MSAGRQRSLVRDSAGEASGNRRPLISVEAAAGLIGVSRSVAYRWARLNCLPGAVLVAGRWYVRRAVLLAWLEGTDGTASPPTDEMVDARQQPPADPRAVREGV